MTVSTNDLNCFKENGYMILKNLFSEDELESVSGALELIAQRELERMGGVPRNNKDLVTMGITALSNTGMINRYAEIIAGISEVARLHSNPNLRSAINYLMNRNEKAPLFLTNNALIISLPDDPDYCYTWHKDTFYTIPQSRYIQIWAPLIEHSCIANGTLRVCPRSHKNGLNGQMRVPNVANRHKYVATDSEVEKYSQIDIELELGSVLLFHRGLIHRSGENISGKARYSLVGVYHDTDYKDFYPVSRKMVWGRQTPDDFYNETISQRDLS